ncbi:MAG TPA: SurA N-terminal domain-containing protein [Terriglobales bacterium]|nr:SurA N-terminal domain-containing protein [Terriglobales bacterium]
MLKFLRHPGSARWIQIVLLFIIIIVFVFFGVGMVGDRTQVVATVNDDPILLNDFNRAYRSMERVYREVYKTQFDENVARSLNLRGRTVEQLVRAKLLRQEAEDLGLAVSDQELRDTIASNTAFHRNGRFDSEVYRRVLGSAGNRFKPSEFEELQREEMLVGKLQDLIVGGVHVSEAEARQRFDYENEKVVLRYVALTPENFLDQAQVSDAEVETYYNEHKEELREPERVRIDYAFYGHANFAEGVQPTPQEIEEYYNSHQDEFLQPEQVHARHILFRTDPTASAEDKAKVRQKAEAVLAQAKGGADFVQLAQQNSEDTSNAAQGGDLGFFPRGRMVPEFEQAAFGLEAGKISDLVETNFGFHIIKVEEKRAAGAEPLEQVRDRIAKKLQKERAEKVAGERANAAHQKITAGESLAAVAQADAIEAKTSLPVAAGETIPGFDHSGPMIEAALKTEANKLGPLLTTSDGVILFRVLEKIPSRVPDLAEIGDKARDAARKAKAAQIAKDRAKELLEQLKTSKDLDTIATAANAKVEETAPLIRAGGFIPGIGASPELKAEAFKLTAEAPVAPQVYELTGKQVLAVLKERVAADEAEFNEKKAQLMAQIEGQRRTEAINAFVAELMDDAEIELGKQFEDVALGS